MKYDLGSIKQGDWIETPKGPMNVSKLHTSKIDGVETTDGYSAVLPGTGKEVYVSREKAKRVTPLGYQTHKPMFYPMRVNNPKKANRILKKAKIPHAIIGNDVFVLEPDTAESELEHGGVNVTATPVKR